MWHSARMRLSPLPEWVVGFRAGPPLDAPFFALPPGPRSGVGDAVGRRLMGHDAAFDDLCPVPVAVHLGALGATPSQVAPLLHEAISVRVLSRIRVVEGRWQVLAEGFPARNHEELRGSRLRARARVENPLGPAIRWNAELSRLSVFVSARSRFRGRARGSGPRHLATVG